MIVVSRRLREAVKLHRDPAYRIAIRADMHPSVLSKLIHGAEPLKPEDPRVLAVAAVVGVPPDECFEETQEVI
jgi:hypothetical protein